MKEIFIKYNPYKLETDIVVVGSQIKLNSSLNVGDKRLQEWIEDLPILLIENDYTIDYLKDINNRMELVYPYLNVDYNYDVFNSIMAKYQIAPSNYLVDIIYEAIIAESNNK